MRRKVTRWNDGIKERKVGLKLMKDIEKNERMESVKK